MRYNRRILVSALTVVVGAGLLALSGCGGKKEKANGVSAGTRAQVQVANVKLADMSETLKVNGEVVAISTVVVTPKVPGRLEQFAIKDEEGKLIPVVEGTAVKAGQQLGVIDHAVYEARLQQAEAAVTAAQAQADDAAREEKRALLLLKEGAATEQMRDKVITGRKAAEAALSQAKAVLDLARIDADESTLKSPINGTVTAKYVDAGNIVSPGVAIAMVQDASRVKILFNFSEVHLARINSGKNPLVASSDVLGGFSITGVVTRVYPAVDKATRTVGAEVIVENTDGRLRPGMFMRVDIQTLRKDAVPVIPATALLRSGEDAYVFVAQGNKAVKRPVELGIVGKEFLEVTKGAKEGDTVIVVGHRLLRDGQEIEIAGEGTK